MCADLELEQPLVSDALELDVSTGKILKPSAAIIQRDAKNLRMVSKLDANCLSVRCNHGLVCKDHCVLLGRDSEIFVKGTCCLEQLLHSGELISQLTNDAELFEWQLGT